MAAVSNSSPLILYAAIGRLELIQELYGEVFVPPAVWQETVDRHPCRPGATELKGAHWIRRQSPSPRHMTALPLAGLHKGEAEAIALAVSFQPFVPILLDDLRARRIAESAGLEVIGAGGILLLAKRRGHITSVRGLLGELQSAGLYLSEAVVDTFLELANER